MALTESFESAKAYYNPAPQNPVELLSKPIDFDLPDCFLREHRNHNMPYMLVDAQSNITVTLLFLSIFVSVVTVY